MNPTKPALAALALAGVVLTLAAPAQAAPIGQGPSTIVSDVSYNAITQVTSFDVALPDST